MSHRVLNFFFHEADLGVDTLSIHKREAESLVRSFETQVDLGTNLGQGKKTWTFPDFTVRANLVTDSFATVHVYGGRYVPAVKKKLYEREVLPGIPYLFIGLQQEGGLNPTPDLPVFTIYGVAAHMHLWEPWPEGGHFIPQDTRLGWLTYGWPCYWCACIGPKNGQDGIALLGITGNTMWNDFVFVGDYGNCDTHIWPDDSRAYYPWYGADGVVSWGNQIHISRYGVQFYGPAMAHDPEEVNLSGSKNLYWEAFLLDPDDKEKNYSNFFKFPDEALGWGYKESDTAQCAIEPGDPWIAVPGTILSGWYLLKLSFQGTTTISDNTAVMHGPLSVKLTIKLGKGIDQEVQTVNLEFPEGPVTSVSKTFYHTHTQGGGYAGCVPRAWQPYGYDEGPPDDETDLAIYQRAKDFGRLGPAKNDPKFWWEGLIAINVRRGQVKVYASESQTPVAFLNRLGFDSDSPEARCATCSGGMDPPIAEEDVIPLPSGCDPALAEVYLLHAYDLFIYMHAVVLNVNPVTGSPCQIQVIDQGCTGSPSLPYGYGYTFFANGILRNTDHDVSDGLDYTWYVGETVMIVWADAAAAGIRHLDDPKASIPEGERQAYVCPTGVWHRNLLDSFGCPYES